MNVIESIEPLESVSQYENDHLEDKQGVTYTVAKQIPLSHRAKNWMSSQFSSIPATTPRIESEDRVYQPASAKKFDVAEYGHATFETKDTNPLQAHFSRSLGARPSPYQIAGSILGATTWSIDHDSNLATPKASYTFQSGLEEAAEQWKAPKKTVRDQYKQSLQKKLTPVTEETTTKTYASPETYAVNKLSQPSNVGKRPWNLSDTRIV